MGDSIGITSDLDVSAIISNGGLQKTGAGGPRLAGANTFASGLSLIGGTLVVANNAAAGTGTLAFSTGTTIQAEGARSLTNALTLGGDFTIAGGVSDSLNFSGAATLTGNRFLTTANTATTTFSGAISQSGGTRGLTKAGAGTLVFSGAGANSYTGNTTINGGTLELSKTAGVNAIAGALAIGDGVGNDTVRLTASNQIADAQTVTINSTDINNRGIFDLNGNSETIGGLTMTGGVATFGFGTLTIGA